MKKLLLGFLASAMLVSACGHLGPQGVSRTGAGIGAREIDGEATGAYDLITLPDQGPGPLIKAIQGAKKSVQLEIYMITNSGAAATVVQALCERAKAGVDVRVMLELQPYIPAQPPHCDAPVPMDVNKKAREALIAGGVKVKYASPKFKYTHEKSMVIDGATTYIMTTNFTGSAFDHNREYVIVSRDPADVREVSNVFEADWNERWYTPSNPNIVLSPSNSRSQLRSLIASATKSLAIEVEFASDPELIALIGEKVKAGVDVTVMMSAQSKDRCTGGDINADERKAFTDVGVQKVAFMKKLTLHAKAIVVDGQRAYLGTENLSANSLDNNREMGIIVSDRRVIAKILDTIKKDWFATTATPADFPVPDAPFDGD
jgi:phosphatidylserine/phosphatidylglycerophosphate/cardiolipin synthase-like enzyme